MSQRREQPILIDMAARTDGAPQSGPQWSYESSDLDLTLLSWTAHESITPHVNTEVDVVLIGVVGTGDVSVDGSVYQLAPGRALLIPRGLERGLRATSPQFSYLSLHRRRRGLWPTLHGEPAGPAG